VTTVELGVRASTHGSEPSLLVARANEFTPRERVRRGIRAFLPLFAAGLGLVILPPHLLWLIGWTAVGAVAGRRRYRQERELVSLAGSCPECRETIELDPPERLPKLQRCPACGAFLALELA
jgi:hypothetical protein